MAIIVLDDRLEFPPPEMAEPDGLLAIGGDLSPARLLKAYAAGIFPWYSEDYILWWNPDPRFVLFPPALRISHSMKKLLRHPPFDFTVNADFAGVIRGCKMAARKDQDGTWITDDMEEAYIELHRLGFAHSAETWKDGRLVGGLYGIRLGKVFFGESMFSLVSNASKFAFIRYVQQLAEEGVRLIDCQVYTEHLESLGAEMIPREIFLGLLTQLVPPFH